MKGIAITLLWLVILCFMHAQSSHAAQRPWKVQSIDTMKYSRDLVRERTNDPAFDQTIDQQVKEIARTGATHVAIGTPYDEEFLPFLRKWVAAARKYDLNVWFRGNFAGWEQWFEYPRVNQRQHTQMTQRFIESNPDIFEDGDIFSSCPECENGGPGDPRETQDVDEYRELLIREYQTAKNACAKIGKNVAANYYSMNGDVARLIMDKETTRALDGIVVIDHYVKTPKQISADISQIAQASGGKVVLGEFGAPIPDIHGGMSEEEQAAWIKDAFKEFSGNDNLIGMNYWTSVAGSTEIWNDVGQPRDAVEVITRFYTGTVVRGQVVNEVGEPVGGVTVRAADKRIVVDDSGRFSLPYIPEATELVVESKTYEDTVVKIPDNFDPITISLTKKREGFWYRIQKFFNWFGEVLNR